MILSHGAVDHSAWCEYEGPIGSLFMPSTGALLFRCPGCWGTPRGILADVA